jgi:AraC-like DNA-binding protein
MPAISAHPDAMSDVLSLVRMRGEVVCQNEYSAPWSYRFGKHVAHFHIVERGAAWILIEGEPARRLVSGDLVILPLGAGHVLSNDPDLAPTPIEEAIGRSRPRQDFVYRLGGGGEPTSVLSGQFTFAGILAPKLLTILPPVIHIEAQEGRPLEWLRLTWEYLLAEMQTGTPGWAIMVSRLIDLLFIQAIRDWGAKSPSNLGWLSGFVDPMIGKALTALHERPARRWTVEGLAEVAGLSRSAFAARFSEVVGQTPLRYLAGWRLDLAADHLRAGGAKIGEIATLVGYGSEAALTRAFKAQFGTTPGAFRRAVGAAQDSFLRRA